MAELRMTRAELARNAGVNATMLRDILDRNSTPSVNNLDKIARALGLSLGSLYDGDEHLVPTVDCVGVAAGEMWTAYDVPQSAPINLDFMSSDFVWVEARDLVPYYASGELIGGPRSSGNNVHSLIGQDVICETTTGQRYVKILAAGSVAGRYSLRSFDVRTPDITNVMLRWAAPVQVRIKGRK